MSNARMQYYTSSNNTIDEIRTWAAVAHELRNLALNYDEATALPLPLHLAKQIEEYTLPLPMSDK